MTKKPVLEPHSYFKCLYSVSPLQWRLKRGMLSLKGLHPDGDLKSRECVRYDCSNQHQLYNIVQLGKWHCGSLFLDYRLWFKMWPMTRLNPEILCPEAGKGGLLTNKYQSIDSGLSICPGFRCIIQLVKLMNTLQHWLPLLTMQGQDALCSTTHTSVINLT